MSSQQQENTNETKTGELCCLNNEESMPSATLSALDRYTALRNHRIRFQDALDPNAERVTVLRKHDIIFGRGKNMQDYPGNRRMRTIINKYKQEYHSIQRSEKRDLVESVYKELVQGGARFLTKAPNDDHFVVVDIEVALQKVGNTLRCRKKWNKVARPEYDSLEKACASLEGNMSVVRQDREVSIPINSAALNQNQAIRSASLVPPPVVLNRSQTMLLLRANTVRLMTRMPLLPATVNEMCYLQRCRSLQRRCLGQLSSTSAQIMQMNSGVVLRGGSPPVGLPKMAFPAARNSTEEFPGTANNSIKK